jgi:hypothetical protein
MGLQNFLGLRPVSRGDDMAPLVCEHALERETKRVLVINNQNGIVR